MTTETDEERFARVLRKKTEQADLVRMQIRYLEEIAFVDMRRRAERLAEDRRLWREQRERGLAFAACCGLLAILIVLILTARYCKMNRLHWILVVILLATNLAWAALYYWTDAQDAIDDMDPTPPVCGLIGGD